MDLLDKLSMQRYGCMFSALNDERKEHEILNEADYERKMASDREKE